MRDEQPLIRQLRPEFSIATGCGNCASKPVRTTWALWRSIKVIPIPTWLFMKGHGWSATPIDVLRGVRYCVEDHKRGAFELGAPATDVLDLTGQPPEDFETIARRYAALPRNQRTVGNWLREFVQFMIAPLRPGFNFDQYDRELRRPFASELRFTSDSKVWRREHSITGAVKPLSSARNTAPYHRDKPRSNSRNPIRRYSSCRSK